MQDRLVKGLRRAKASSCAEARRYLDEVFVAEWNSRWKKLLLWKLRKRNRCVTNCY